MVRRLEPNLFHSDVNLCVKVFLHLAIGMGRNSEVKKMSSDSHEWNSFANIYREVLTKILWRKMRKMWKYL